MKNKNIFRLFRNLTILFVLSLVVLLPGVASAAVNAVVSVAVPVDALDPGEQFTISINVEPNNAIAGMQFNLSFDPDIVIADSVVEGNLLNQGGASTYFNTGQIDNMAGTITGAFGAIISPGQTVATAGTFAVITLTAGSVGGSCPLTLSNVIIGDLQGQSLPLSVINDTITVAATTTDSPPSGGGDGGGGGGGGSGGGGGGGASGITSLRGSTTTNGLMVEDVSATDIDLKVELRISKGTIVKNRAGQALTSIRITPKAESQPANSGSAIISQSYEFEPSGTTFDASATLIFKYSSSEIPADIPVSNLYIALWDPDAMTWTYLGGTVDANTRTVSVSIKHLSTYALMAYNRPASLKVTKFALTPGEVAPGETVTANIEVNNQGDLIGTYEVILKLDNTAVATKVVTLNGGSNETIVFTVTSDTVGEHKASLGDTVATFIVKKPLSPAAFTVNELSINPLIADLGKIVEVSAIIKNIGDLAGNYQIILSVDDVAVETKEVALDGGRNMTMSFSFTPDTVGQHSVSIGSSRASFEVKPPPLPAVTEVTKLELSSFSTAPSYDKTTNTLVFVRIAYQMNQNYEDSPSIKLVLTVFLNGELLEQVPLLTLSELQEDGKTGELNYIPSAGWGVGEYTFQAELYDGENLVQDTLLQHLIVTPESITKVVSWWKLGAVIGIATVLIIVLIAFIIYRRRDMLGY